MALTGLEIFKLLPNKNCGECDVPTCLAFAMKLASKSAEPTACPYISDEALSKLGESQAPPIKNIKFKTDNNEYELGSETVIYRHEKTFVNQPLIALEISDNLNDSEFTAKLDIIKSAHYERVGEELYPECISLLNESNDTDNYVTKYKLIQDLNKVIILSETTPEIAKKIAEIESNKSRLIINSAKSDNLTAFIDIVKDTDIKLVIEADTVESLFDLSDQTEKADIRNIILKTNNSNTAKLLENNVVLRRLSIKKGFKPAGYPILTECADKIDAAITGICKYSSIIILKEYDGATLFPLLTLRQNIYTDPQKPLQIEWGVYDIGEPTPDDPLVVTTNFSLTYFIVSGEIDNSAFNGRILITDSEGMSVLTAWSANKFSPEIIAKAVKESKVAEKINHRKLIIPGYVAILQGDLEDELSDWNILVGPQEAADLPQYLKETWK